ncbi:hypothetical protein B6A42_19840 [Vibrio coralliilyticus]|nr:hypothetical protein B6A42_19840 [Vibrio coralliilyticus]
MNNKITKISGTCLTLLYLFFSSTVSAYDGNTIVKEYDLQPFVSDTIKGSFKSGVASLYGYPHFSSATDNNTYPMRVVDGDDVTSTAHSVGIPINFETDQTVKKAYMFVTLAPISLRSGTNKLQVDEDLEVQFGQGQLDGTGVSYPNGVIRSMKAGIFESNNIVTFLFDVTSYVNGDGTYWLAEPRFKTPNLYNYSSSYETNGPSLFDLADPQTKSNTSHWGIYILYETPSVTDYKKISLYLPNQGQVQIQAMKFFIITWLTVRHC